MTSKLCEDAMTGDTDKYLGPQDIRELGDDSLPAEGYMGFNLGARSASLRSFSSDRSYTLNRSSYTRDSVMIEELLAPSKDTHLTAPKEFDSDSLNRYSWTADTLDNVNLVSSPVHSGFLVSFMVDARGGSMRGSRHNGMRIVIPPRKCTAPTRITCRLVKRHKLASPPPMVEGEGLASRLVEVGPAGAQFLGPVIVEIPHFGSMRGKERELIVLRSENGEHWKEHHYDCKHDDLNDILNGMDEELDSPEELEKKCICRIITKDFPQYFAVVSRIKQESNQIGPEGGELHSTTVKRVEASFPEGALTKRIRVGLQAQPVPDELVKKTLGNKATFSPIVTVEPRRRKFHKPITMTIPVPPPSGEGISNGYRGEMTPSLRLLCSITGGTSPAQWEDITGTTPLTFVNDCVSFTTNVSARFWLADCHQVPETVGLATQLYRELICVPYMAKFVVFAKLSDPIEANLRCFCMTDDKVDKTLEQQENFEEVARSKDIEVLEGKQIFVDCYGNLAPLVKGGQLLVFNFFAFKENRLPFSVKVRDASQEPCGRLSFLKEPKTTKGLPQAAICNLNITLPVQKKAEKADRRQSFVSLALRPQSPCERTDIRMAIVADHLGLSWTELARELNFTVDEINQIRVENPNSLTTQSFMLLKKWVHRDGKNATTDILTNILTKINRMDIVTLLEGPIFDYGNISGTRSFVEDDSVFQDQSDGYPTIQMEVETPTGLRYLPPTPLRSDDYFSDISSIDSPHRTPSRLSDILATSQTDGDFRTEEPPVVVEEDTSLDDSKVAGSVHFETDHELSTGQSKKNDIDTKDFTEPVSDSNEIADILAQKVHVHFEDKSHFRDEQPFPVMKAHQEEGQYKSGFDEWKAKEITKSVFEDIRLEDENEREEMTEEQLHVFQNQIQNAKQEISSFSGWHDEASRVNVEKPAAGCNLSEDVSDSQDHSRDLNSESITSYLKGQMRKLELNGEHTDARAEATTRANVPELSDTTHDKNGKDSLKPKMQKSPIITKEETGTAEVHHKSLAETSRPVLEESASTLPAGEKKLSCDRESGKSRLSTREADRETVASEQMTQEDWETEPSSDEERAVTTRVIRRRVILKGEEAKNIPSESVTEEKFVDEEGNVITRKVFRKVIRRVVPGEDRGHMQEIKEKDGEKQGEAVRSVKVKKDTRPVEKKNHS